MLRDDSLEMGLLIGKEGRLCLCGPRSAECSPHPDSDFTGRPDLAAAREVGGDTEVGLLIGKERPGGQGEKPLSLRAKVRCRHHRWS